MLTDLEKFHPAQNKKSPCMFIDFITVRPRDTRPQAARTLQVHVFELGPKIFEMHVFARFCMLLHVFARFFDK